MDVHIQRKREKRSYTWKFILKKLSSYLRLLSPLSHGVSAVYTYTSPNLSLNSLFLRPYNFASFSVIMRRD